MGSPRMVAKHMMAAGAPMNASEKFVIEKSMDGSRVRVPGIVSDTSQRELSQTVVTLRFNPASTQGLQKPTTSISAMRQTTLTLLS